ncbi:hypothetical protein LTR49_026375 [Elasticomyces elasticus]|nr:hypothetical protein LTR49_026375 [Elasticomyces elasticus]KAK5740168.1 hypothetical protein LTS12_025045 [Elasticomyces elasticus]
MLSHTVVTLFLAATAYAASLASLSASSYSTCYTDYVSTLVKRAKTRSSVRTTTSSLYHYETITPVLTVTPEATGTSTIAAPSGFLPVRSTIPSAPLKKRSVAAVQQTSPRHGTFFARAQTGITSPVSGQPSWANSVTCEKLVVEYPIGLITKTARKTITNTLAASTQTDTVSKLHMQALTAVANGIQAIETNTITSSVGQQGALTTVRTDPSALQKPGTLTATQIYETSTFTDVVTFTPSTTSTTTVIATQRLVFPTATVYAACGPDNIATCVNGSPIIYVATSSPNFEHFGTTSDRTPYDCCVSCMNDPLCALSSFYAQSKDSTQCTISSPLSASLSNRSMETYLPSHRLRARNTLSATGVCGLYDYATLE